MGATKTKAAKVVTQFLFTRLRGDSCEMLKRTAFNIKHIELVLCKISYFESSRGIAATCLYF